MANEMTQRTVVIELTIELPLEHAYLNSELIDTLHIKSEYKEIKIIEFKESAH